MENVDVVVVGGGPVGLALAGELTLAGVRPVVLERLTERSPVPKANGLVGQVVRWLYHRGLYQRLTGNPAAPQPTPQYMFGGLPLPIGTWPENPLHTLPLPQWDLERGLGDWVAESGVDVRRDVEVTGFTQDDDGVTVDYTGTHGSASIRARYLAGCDGAHSVVRKQAGIDFVGVSTERVTSHTAHVVLGPGLVNQAGVLQVPGLGALTPFTFHRTDTGVFVYGTFQPDTPLVTFMEWDRPPADDDTTVTIEDLRAAAKRVLGVELDMSLPRGDGRYVLRRVSGARNSRQADRYRAGRVFVAGDAAHVHAATGGPGLNLGLLDIANLGWKLAASIHGWAADDLLDTYHAERHPVGERVVMQTQAQSALLEPGSQVTALRQLFTELIEVPDNARRIAELMAGADIRYPCGGDTAHPLAGKWVPDFPMTVTGKTVRLAELARSARPQLLDHTGDTGIAEIARHWSDRVDLVVATTANPPAPAVLIRPDGHAAWIADTDPGQWCASLSDALRTWFGAPLQ